MNINQEIIDICSELADTLAKKNADYGNSAFERPVLAPNLDSGTAIRVRMSDKVARIVQLEQNANQVKAESLRDSYFDLCGYAVLRIIQLEKENAGNSNSK